MAESSGLFYHGTADEVRLGDRVRIKRLFRRGLEGTVCYIPGVSPRHPEMEDDFSGSRQWAVRGDDGCVYPILYDPADFQPPKKIVLLSRGSTGQLTPDEPLA